MNTNKNALGQPIGEPLPDWEACIAPPGSPMPGLRCDVVPLDIDAHATDLFNAFAADSDAGNWTYLPYGPFSQREEFVAWLKTSCCNKDPLFHSVIDKHSGAAVGLASYLRIEPAIGVIEVGHIHFSPRLQRTSLSTEAMYLMMKRVFDELGYRRYEWKCDALNQPSRNAAERLGFQFEGIFRQATMYKSRNRDTAWFSILDHEWPALRNSFESWLNPANFDPDGRQRQSLTDLR
ncbi:MAG: GNAT family N-acetyltransferase [Gammaproteobacteria bacterium]|nr:GNAT family N-acetyltransferase [Gammaproteobacteria bacterium]